MNASATIRASYIRRNHLSTFPRPLSIPSTIHDLEPRPADPDKLRFFKEINHIAYREQCHLERTTPCIHFDLERNADTDKSYIDNRYLDTPPFTFKLHALLTTFPYRDPIYLVALIFLLGSLNLVVDAFFDILPPATSFAQKETIAIPTTVLIGSIFFFAAGALDTICALNADKGSVDDKGVYKPAMLGSPEFNWLPGWQKTLDLAVNNLAFQAGLLVLFGGVVFLFAGIVDFPGIVREENNPFFKTIVFGPQILHGAVFFVGNVLLAVAVQERWWMPKVWDADWQGAVLNAVGGFGFMVAGGFLFEGSEEEAGVAGMVGSWAFVLGSGVRLWVVVQGEEW